MKTQSLFLWVSMAVAALTTGSVRAQGSPATFFEADLVRVGQAPFAEAGLPAGELVDALLPAGPGGTGTAFPEPFQYQLGATYDPSARPHPMLVAYHGFGGSAASVATQSTLDEVCNQRGWVYLSVTGLDDKLFGTALPQQHVEATIAWMLAHYNIDADRVCMVGFSMGAGVTLNFAARHRDPNGIVLAAVGLVSVSADWTSAWETGSATVKAVLENPLNFGTTPALDAFVYRRWSGTYHAGTGGFGIGELQPDQSLASNLGSTPVYLTWDTGDPTLFVTDQCSQLAGYLPTLGGEVTVKTVSGTIDPVTGSPAPHSWAVLKEGQLLNFFGSRTADRRPARIHALVAEDRVVGGVRLEQRQPGMFSGLSAEFEPELRATLVENLRTVSMDGKGGAADRRVHALSGDGLGFELRLGGFATRPSYLLASSNGSLVQDVRSEPWADALVLDVAADGLDAVLVAREGWSGTLTVSPDPAPAGERIHLFADGPSTARTAWLVFGTIEELSPVLGSAATLGVRPRPPAFIRRFELDAGGDLSLEPLLPPALAIPGGHLHVQALFLDGHHAPVAVSNTWMLRWED